MPPALPDDPYLHQASVPLNGNGNGGNGNNGVAGLGNQEEDAQASAALEAQQGGNHNFNDENAPPPASANLHVQVAVLGATRAHPRGPEFDSSDETGSDGSAVMYDETNANARADGRGPDGTGDRRRGEGGEGKAEGDAGGASGQRNDELWRGRIIIGSALDVLDTVGKWSEAEVTAVDRVRHLVKISYTFWADRWDEWIPINSPRLAPPGSRTYQEGGDLCVNHRIEIQDPRSNYWWEGGVVSEAPDSVEVQYRRDQDGPVPPPNEWLRRDSERIRPYGREKSVFSRKRSRRLATLPLLPGQPGQPEPEQHRRQIVPLSDRYGHYLSALLKRELVIHPVQGDGNCLFRSVSHQIYGDDRHHALVRAKCMDYMESERHYFEPYVEGGMDGFLRYVDMKRRNAVWGDDPEVQALCEMYNRAAEIWAYDAAEGAKMLRTFHETGGSKRMPPVRLSYYGGGHYDSVVSCTDLPAHERHPPGAVEDEAIARSRARVAGALGSNGGGGGGGGASSSAAAAAESARSGGGLLEAVSRRSDELATEQAALDLALLSSRDEFDAQFDDLEGALCASMEHIERQEAANVAAVAQDSELIALQEQMLRSAQTQSEEDQLQKALRASMIVHSTSGGPGLAGAGAAGAAAAGASFTATSKEGGSTAAASSPALAVVGPTAGPVAGPVAGMAMTGADADDLDSAIRASLRGVPAAADEDAELQQALRLSAALAGVAAGIAADAEDPELAAALALSLKEDGGGGNGSGANRGRCGEDGFSDEAMAALAWGDLGLVDVDDEELSKAIAASLSRP